MKIASIIGACPQFIKCAPLSREIRKKHEEVLVHTGQHYDHEMNKIFFDELRIPEPDYHLGVGSGSHGEQTGEMIKRIEKVLMKEKPDLVLVYGDTNSTLAGALAASKLYLKVGHVEAGLRSFDRRMPEEINRLLTDHCSDLLFCPTRTSVGNLKKEGITKEVYLTGDVMVDALRGNIKIAEQESKVLDELGLKSKKYHLATVHRAENTDDFYRLRDIVDAFCEIEDLVFPCHPRTEKMLKNFNLWEKLIRKVRVIKPVGYLDMLMLEKNAKKILTDSGGVQKEAYILKVPCVTLRSTTEWVETLEDGWNVLVGAKSLTGLEGSWVGAPYKEKIVKVVNEFEPENGQRNIFGGENTSEIIVNIMEDMRANNGR